jgi:hypothetical protein
VYFLEVPDLDLIKRVIWVGGGCNKRETSYHGISFIFSMKEGRLVNESDN